MLKMRVVAALVSSADLKMLRPKWQEQLNIFLEKDRFPIRAALRIEPMQKQIFALAVVTLFGSSALVISATDTPETRRREAERYLQASPPKALFEDMADKMAANLPPDQREQFKRVMTTQLDIAVLTKATMDAMVKNFTTDELKALADFFGSPVGKSAMQKFGTYMADIMPVMQAEIIKASAKLNQSLPNQSPR
jgi:hypothetical protein